MSAAAERVGYEPDNSLSIPDRDESTAGKHHVERELVHFAAEEVHRQALGRLGAARAVLEIVEESIDLDIVTEMERPAFLTRHRA